MTNHPRRHQLDAMEGLLRDMDLRITMRERKWLGHKQEFGVSYVRSQADLPEAPTVGDLAKVVGTGEVWQCLTAGNWTKGGTIP